MTRNYILLLPTEKLIEELEYHEKKVAERQEELRSRLVDFAKREKTLPLEKLEWFRTMETLLTAATPQEIEHSKLWLRAMIYQLSFEEERQLKENNNDQ
jgi:hypothetical protein